MPVPGKMCGASGATGRDYNTGFSCRCEEELLVE